MELLTATAAWLADAANWQGPNGIPQRALEHVALSGASVLAAALLALPLGLWAGHRGRMAWLVVSSANAWRALPSFAVIGLVVPLTTVFDPQAGFTTYPTLAAMVLLAFPPLLVNSYQGVAGVDRELVDAARAMGMRERQILLDLEVPVAVPVIATGLRSAVIQVVATATLGAIFGFGGLGRYIVIGSATQNDGELFGGVVLVAALALGSFAFFSVLERLIVSPGLAASRANPRTAG